jgi:hypothetical protein
MDGNRPEIQTPKSDLAISSIIQFASKSLG